MSTVANSLYLDEACRVLLVQSLARYSGGSRKNQAVARLTATTASRSHTAATEISVRLAAGLPCTLCVGHYHD